MKTPQFIEYLHDDPATTTLAEELAGVLGLRGRPDLVPISVRASGARRIAS